MENKISIMLKLLFIFLFICLLSSINCDMNHIIDNIYLGDSVAANDEANLEENNITAVVNTAASCQSNYKKLRYIELNLVDKTNEKIFPKFDVAYKFVKEYNNTNILVHCHKGRSRSSAFVIYYLMKEREWDYDTCIKYIKVRRPIVNPNSGFVQQLRDYYDKYIKNKIK